MSEVHDMVVARYRTTALVVLALLLSALAAAPAASAGTRDAAPYGHLQVCKVAADGRLTGVYSFTISSLDGVLLRRVRVAVGRCSEPLRVPAGPKVVTEEARSGTVVTGIAVHPPGRRLSSSVALGRVRVAVPAGEVGSRTLAVFANRGDPAPTGLIDVCNSPLDGLTLGAFGFTIAPESGPPIYRPISVGECTGAIEVPAGRVTVTEAARPDNEVPEIMVHPVRRAVAVDLSQAMVTVRVPVFEVPTDITQVTVYNRVPRTALIICAQTTSDSGELEGMEFDYSISSFDGNAFPQQLLAGPAGTTVCRGGPDSIPAGTGFSIRGFAEPGVQVIDVVVDARAGSGSGGAVGEGGQAFGWGGVTDSTVTFLLRAAPSG